MQIARFGFQNGWQLTRINKIQIFKWYLINANFQFRQNFFLTKIHSNLVPEKNKKKQISSQVEKTFL